MNNYRDNTIGTDPTNVPIIETLDVAPKSKEPKKKNNDVIKKVLFTVVVVALMLGVAYGLYYYLSLAQKNKKASNFTLLELTIVEGQELSQNIKDYGNFNDIDTSTCSINLSNVKNSEVGSYKYSVKCYKTEKESIINVIQFNNLKVTTKLSFKKLGDVATTKTFVRENGEYTYTLANANDANLNNEGLKAVAVEVTDTNNNHEQVYGLVNVLSEDYLLIMECQKGNEVNKIAFNYGKKKIGNVIQINEIIYEDENALIDNIMKINDGYITIDNYSGYGIVDYENLKIQIVNSIEKNDIAGDYDNIKSYFEQKEFTCK